MAVQVFVFGKTETTDEILIGEFFFNPFYIVDAEEDWYYDNYPVPLKGLWSFRLLLTDEWGDSVDGFPYDFDTSMVKVPMESDFEDLHFAINNSTVHHLWEHDVDYDGYSVLDSMTILIGIPDYDTSIMAEFGVRIFIRNASDAEYFLLQAQPLYQDFGSQWWWWIHVWAGHEGLWDFRIELLNSFGEVVHNYDYGTDWDLMDIPMELWIEDPRKTYVFDPNPIVRLNQNPFVDIDTLLDHGDSNYMAMQFAMTPVELQGLWYQPGMIILLGGDYVFITDILPYYTDPAVSFDNEFPYFRSEDQFEEVMAYYHIDRNQRYLQSIGYDNLVRYPIEVDPHGLANLKESGYIAYGDSGGKGFILLGDGGVDFAEDADAIMHEYGHAIVDNLAWDTFRTDTIVPQYLNEGFAFYWAASSNDSASQANGFPSASIYEWLVKGFVPEWSDYFNLDHYKTYPDSLKDEAEDGHIHRNGEFWGGVLWDIFTTFGKIMADSIIIEGYENLSAWALPIDQPTFRDAANCIQRAAGENYGEDVRSLVCGIFEQRGFFMFNKSAYPTCDPCYCGTKGDMDNDGVVTPLDVTLLVQKVYKAQDNLYDYHGLHNCPYENGDVDCSGGTPSPLDTTVLVKYVYKFLDALCVDRCTM